MASALLDHADLKETWGRLKVMLHATKTLERIAIAIIAFRLPVLIMHSVAHSELQIYLAPWQNAYILFVIVVLPLLSGFLLWRRSRLAFFLLFISMFGSLVFGGYYHFLAPGPDNVNQLGHHDWTVPFQVSAVMLGVVEAAGAAIGLAGLLTNPRGA